MPSDTADPTQPAFLAIYLAGLPQPEHDHADPARSVREDDFDGHHVVITTTYEITVDGRPLDVHIGLSNDGSAHCHGLPAYQLPSLVDLVRVLIRTFPDEFSPQPTPTGGHDGEHGGEHGGDGAGSHPEHGGHVHDHGDTHIHGDETLGGL